jgi:predicted O-linked N-acetylglucosamine transferase (SPINDLY family)
LAHHWRDVAGLPDAQVDAMIREDAIDVLVDLAGHTGGNRLALMARRPAPVQVTYLGYPLTTGMSAIDYRISDDCLDPPGEMVRHAVEEPVRIPGGQLCFRPSGPDEVLPEVNELPALGRGYVTFAARNRLLKATPSSFRMWAGVLAAVPNSKLMIIANGEDSGTRNVLEGYGIPIERVVFMRRQGRSGYFRSFHDCDIALDSFPYSGQTSTCDAMWMGVPTVTMTGSTHHSRIGESLARAVGLEELVARSPEEYVQIAGGLAADLPRLAALRRNLRDRMQQSPLCDGRRVAAGLEAAYRQMWTRWCASHAAISS